MKLVVFISFLFLMNSNLFADQTLKLKKIDWKTHSKKDGIHIFVPKSFKHKSGLTPIRFKTVINWPILKVLSVLADNDRKNEWVPKHKESTMLESISLREQVIYYRYDSPWPFNDRVFILRQLASENKKEKAISVDLKSVDHPKAKKDSSSVIGITYDGYTTLKAVGENQTELEMAFLNDFGGNIPKFVINWVQKNWPYKFMKNLSKQLAKDDIVINKKFIQK